MSLYAIEDTTLTAIADAIRAKDGTTDTITPENMPAKMDEVFAAGEKSEYDKFWDDYQNNGALTDYRFAFAGRGWKDENFRPKYDIIPVGAVAEAIFKLSKIVELESCLQMCGVKLDTSQASRVASMFYYSSATIIPDLDFRAVTHSSGLSDMFAGATNLHTIRKIILPSNRPISVAYMVANCTALENLNFEGTISANGLDIHWSTLLTHDSLLSIINALADYSADTSGTVWTVTLGDTNLAKLSEEEIAIAETKGWVLA